MRSGQSDCNPISSDYGLWIVRLTKSDSIIGNTAYDAIEGQLRSHKKLAKELIDSTPAEIASPTKARGSKKELDKDGKFGPVLGPLQGC